MSVRVLNGWTDPDWETETNLHREATFFHTRAWARICGHSFPQLRDLSRWIEVTTESGTSRHLLPLLAWRRAGGLMTTTHSSFPHIYGGPLPIAGAGGRSIHTASLDYLEGLPGSILVTGNPLSGRPLFGDADRASERRAGRSRGNAPAGIATIGSTAAWARPGWDVTASHTHLRALPETDAEFWEEELDTRKRNDVRRLTKKGVSIDESNDPSDVSRLYELYLASFERWGGRPAFLHPEAFYQNLVAMGGDAVRLTVARFEGRVIGGVLAIRYGRTVHYFAGYFDAEAKSLRPNVLLQVDSIRRAIAAGFAFYDFLPSGGNESVEQFKEGFGGVRVEVPVFHRRSLGHRLLARVRRR